MKETDETRLLQAVEHTSLTLNKLLLEMQTTNLYLKRLLELFAQQNPAPPPLQQPSQKVG